MSSKIRGFFDHQYCWKETVIFLYFMHRDSNQRKAVFKIAAAGWNPSWSACFPVSFSARTRVPDLLHTCSNKKFYQQTPHAYV